MDFFIHFFIHCVYVRMHLCVCTGVAEGNLKKSVLSLHHLVPWTELTFLRPGIKYLNLLCHHNTPRLLNFNLELNLFSGNLLYKSIKKSFSENRICLYVSNINVSAMLTW